MSEDDNIAKEESLVKTKEETSLTNADYQRNRLFKKGILHMADEKLEEACRDFEMLLRAEVPKDVRFTFHSSRAPMKNVSAEELAQMNSHCTD